jgi:hypothetical protein
MSLNIVEELEYQNYLLESQIKELKELVGTDTIKLLKAIENIRDIANELRPLPYFGPTG